jgi:hypothetical protein
MRRSLTLGMCLVFCCATSTVVAQSLIDDTFDTNVDDWPVGTKSTIIWDSLDANLNPESGSALATNISDSAGDGTGPEQCVDGVVAGGLYRASADILIPEGQSETGFANLLVRWYGDACLGTQTGPLASSNGVSTSETGIWYADVISGVAPPGTRSARFRLTILQWGDSGTLASHFDNVKFELVDRYLSFVPAAGLAPGDAGSFWVTDLEVNNPNGEATTYELWWLPRGEDNSEPMVSELFTLDAEESRRHRNVLGEVFGLDPGDTPFGALAIASDRAGALAMARVFNQPGSGGEGTYGQAIPGVPEKMMIRQAERLRILFMSEDDELRANVGCQNGTAANLRIMIELFDASGESYGLETLDLPPYSNNQINRIFRDWAPISGYVDVWSTTSRASFYCYGSVLDNLSSDPTTVLPQ